MIPKHVVSFTQNALSSLRHRRRWYETRSMPFPSTGTVEISNKDVVSYAFDDPEYDIDRPLYIDPRNPSIYYSHRTSKDLVRRLIAGLHAAGLHRNDTVCIHSFSSLEYPLLVLAVIGAGGRSVGTNPSYTRGELGRAVKLAQVKFVLAEPEILPNMQAALQSNNINIHDRLFVLDTQPDQHAPPGLPSWRTLLSHGTRDWLRFDDEHLSTTTVCQLYFTSGTTGLPKCAMTTHRNLVAEHQIFYGVNPRPYTVSMVYATPFFHVGMLPSITVTALREGREAYVMRRFELEPFLSYHATYRLTEMFAVPPIVVAVVMSGLADPESKAYNEKYSLRTVRNGTVGAAPCSADMQRRMQRLLAPEATFMQVWGMTETTCVAAHVPFDVARSSSVTGSPKIWGAVGQACASTSLKLVDEEGNDVTHKGRGELCVRGPSVVKGYFDNEAATKAAWDSDGFFRTGDVVQVDEETQMMFVVERVKDLIKVRGFQVAPAELEGALLEHPGIVDAAVIGIESADGKENELPRAYVVIRQGWDLVEEDVTKHMKERVAGYKQLTGGVVFRDSVPKLPSGKILKRVLREEVKAEKRGNGPKL